MTLPQKNGITPILIKAIKPMAMSFRLLADFMQLAIVNTYKVRKLMLTILINTLRAYLLLNDSKRG